MEWRTASVPWAGLAVGPAAWGLNTQLNYSLAPWSCGHSFNVIAPISAVLAIAAVAGAFVSWRAWMTIPAQASIEAPESAQPHRFLAGIGLGLCALFGVVIAMQGLASLILSGCAR